MLIGEICIRDINKNIIFVFKNENYQRELLKMFLVINTK